MTRRKKPEFETEEEMYVRTIKETISNVATRNEKVSWNRKMDNMQTLIEKINPLEDQITELIAQKQPIMDGIQSLRQEMVNNCVHPFDHLIVKDDHVVCKFCFKKFVVNENGK
jgi:hypothetical protein